MTSIPVTKAGQADTTQRAVASRTGWTGAEHAEFAVTPAPDGSVEHGAEQAVVAASALSPAAATAGTLGGALSAATPAAAASAAARGGAAAHATVSAGLTAVADDLTPADVGMRRQQRLRIGWHTTSLTGLARLSSLVDDAFMAEASRQAPAAEAAPASSPALVSPTAYVASPALVSPTALVGSTPAYVASPPALVTAPAPVKARSKRLAMIPTVVVAGALAFAVAVWASKGLKEDGVGADPTEVCLSSECVAWAGFTASTNVLRVCDKRADSVAAVAIYTIGGSAAQQRLWDSGGAGNCSESTLNVAEGTAVTYRVCSGDQSEARVDECSDAITNYA